MVIKVTAHSVKKLFKYIFKKCHSPIFTPSLWQILTNFGPLPHNIANVFFDAISSNKFRLPLFNYLLRCHRLICFFYSFLFLPLTSRFNAWKILPCTYSSLPNKRAYTLIYVEENSNQHGLIWQYITVSKNTYTIINFHDFFKSTRLRIPTSHLFCRLE